MVTSSIVMLLRESTPSFVELLVARARVLFGKSMQGFAEAVNFLMVGFDRIVNLVILIGAYHWQP